MNTYHKLGQWQLKLTNIDRLVNSETWYKKLLFDELITQL